MDKKLEQELLTDTNIEDISPKYRPIVDIVGIQKFLQLSDYAKGDKIYFPKVESILAPARNRLIYKEYNGYNKKDMAEKYNLTIPQIEAILKSAPKPGQINLYAWGRDADIDI